MADPLENLDLSTFLKYEIVKESGKITNIKVTQVDIPGIVEHIYERVDPNNNLKDTFIHQQYNILGHDQKLLLATQMLITRYCIHRVLTHFKIYQEAAWTYQVGADYYGEEINKVHLKAAIGVKISNLLEHLRVRNISEKIEVILKMEYGHLIPSVQNKKWLVKQIPKDKLHYSNNEHYTECLNDLTKPDNLEYKKSLEEYPYPRAITILSPDGKYKVIDGYHRLVGTPDDTSPLVIYCLR
jgi:hypothetical protein